MSMNDINNLPFAHVLDDEVLHLNVDNTVPMGIDDLNQITFNQFHEICNRYNSDFDPDLNNFHNVKDNLEKCKYYFNDDFSHDKLLNNNEFSILSLNINSIPHNLIKFCNDFVNTTANFFDVMGFCETKLIDEIDNLYEINGYNKFTSNKTRHEGGLALYVNEKYKNVIVRDDLNRKRDHIETLFVEIEILKNNNNVICCELYRKPSSNIVDFIDDLEQILEILSCENKKIYIMGDFNVNLFNCHINNHVRDFVNLMHSKNLYCTINKSTRVTSTTNTLIDHIWTNDYLNCSVNGIICEHVSDHLPVFSNFHFPLNNTKIKAFKNLSYRDFKNENILNFRNELVNVNWRLVFVEDVNVAYDNFMLIFTNMFHKHFPLINRKIKINHDNPWITPHIKNRIKEKNKLQRKFAKWPLTYGNAYRQIRNRLTDEIRIAKKQYLKDRLGGCAGNPKGTWKVLNNILNKNNKTSMSEKFEIGDEMAEDCLEISHGFNNYFADVGPSLAENIIDLGISPENYFRERCRDSLVFRQITENELIDLVMSLTDVSAGYDLIPIKLVKSVINEIKVPLTYIYNLSFTSGIFPEKLKISRVTPIHKTGKKTLFKNYRPISILPVFSKILEKLVNDRLQLFLQTNSIINNSQHGFQKFKSTTSALLSLSDYILSAFDQKKYVIAIFLDFSKAFDTVDHDILLLKLEHSGIRGICLDWFKSYLKNRKQFTEYNNTRSTKKDLKYSVPQGSILGPILFNIYINDFINSLSSLNLTLFADDSCLYLSHSDIKNLITTSNDDLENVYKWLNSNKLTLNLNKSHYMIFHRLKMIPCNLSTLTINNEEISKVDQTEFLGITLQYNLKWNKHINNISNKLNKYSSIFYQIRNFLDKQNLKLLYDTLVFPQLTYGNVIWGNTCKTLLSSLFISQKRVIRTIMFRNRRHHTNEDFKNLKILKLNDINTYFGLCFVYKSLNLITFPIDYFTHSQNPNYNFRHMNELRPIFASTKQGQSSPGYYCSVLWNHLPLSIRNKPSISSFKLALRSHLIDQY